MASFLLGAWIAGTVFLAALSLLSVRAPNIVLAVPHPAAAKITQQIGQENMSMLLRHAAAEQVRFMRKRWELTELALGFALLTCLFLGTERRILPLTLCGIMLLIAAFELSGVTAELAYRGRQTDFPPGNAAVAATTRVLLLEQVYFGAELMKLIAAAILASFLFTFRASRRRVKDLKSA